MFIDELTAGQKVKLIAKVGSETIEFEVMIKEAAKRKHAIFTEVVMKNDKVLGFSGSGIFVHIEASRENNSPLLFMNVSIMTAKGEEGPLYYITCNTQGVPNNRRKSFRVFLGKEIVVQCGSNHSTVEATLKDVSATGFAVTITKEDLDKKNLEFREGQIVHITLTDRIEELYKDYNFQLYGLVVRKQELENGLLILGCKLDRRIAGLDSYIAAKERIRIRNNSLNK